jgi:hypothetical protein
MEVIQQEIGVKSFSAWSIAQLLQNSSLRLLYRFLFHSVNCPPIFFFPQLE